VLGNIDPYGRNLSPDPRKKPNLIPQNPRLWAMVQREARMRFRQFPSLPASKWMHDEYIKRGGIFVTSKKQDLRHKHGRQTEQGKKEEEQEKTEAKRSTRSGRRKPKTKKESLEKDKQRAQKRGN
jgi:hypothetical protein